jgi:hypothetical protein
MFALQIVKWMYMGPPDVRYFLEYPLGNTRHPLDHCAKTTGRMLGLLC